MSFLVKFVVAAYSKEKKEVIYPKQQIILRGTQDS
jgi:hypothetical protein